MRVQDPADLIRASATRHGDRTALVCRDRSLTYGELDAAVNRVASALSAGGVRPGAAVTLFSENRWEWVAAYHGILRAGCVVNPVNAMLTAPEVAAVVGSATLDASAAVRAPIGPRTARPNSAVRRSKRASSSAIAGSSPLSTRNSASAVSSPRTREATCSRSQAVAASCCRASAASIRRSRSSTSPRVRSNSRARAATASIRRSLNRPCVRAPTVMTPAPARPHRTGIASMRAIDSSATTRSKSCVMLSAAK
ncbi:AMP-binding protein [Streptomyces sp. NPDC001002]